jgi:hypothetical protein
MVAVGVICIEPLAPTPPMPWLILIDVEPETSHVRVETPPALIVVGLTLKVFIIGAPAAVTVIVAVAVELPALLEAVSVYVVVAPGATLFVPVNDTAPISGLMETDVASATLHDNVADCPAKILPVLKLKLSMDGAGSLTVMVLDPSAEPNRLLATSVYLVVVSGDTVLIPLDDTVPIPGLMETDDTPVTFHFNVVD